MAATRTSPVCLKCGIVKKSGKLSCCGHGGSWFGNCGSDGNSKLGHTWHEGIRVCKDRQFQAAMVQQLHSFQSNTGPSSAASVMNNSTESKAVAVGAHMVALTRVNSSTPVLGTMPMNVAAKVSTISPVDTSMTMREFGELFSVVAYISTTCINVCWW